MATRIYKMQFCVVVFNKQNVYTQNRVLMVDAIYKYAYLISEKCTKEISVSVPLSILIQKVNIQHKLQLFHHRLQNPNKFRVPQMT